MSLRREIPYGLASALLILFLLVLGGNAGAVLPSCINGPVWMGDDSYDTSILSAYSNTSIDSIFYVEGTTHLGTPLTEHLVFSGKDIAITLLGGYTCDFQTNDDYTEINGFLLIESGTVTVSNIILTSIPQTLTINSSNPSNGVSILVDINGMSFLSVATPYEPTVSMGDIVILTAAPFAPNGFPFDSWSGCDSTTSGNICNVIMTDNRTVTATYSTPPQNTLNVNSQPPTGIAVGAAIDNSSQNLHVIQTLTTNSSGLVNSGSSVTLTAPALAGSYGFTSWSGCDNTIAYECLLNMSGDKTVTANYVLPPSFIYLGPLNANFFVNINPYEKRYFFFHIPSVSGSGIRISYICYSGCSSHLLVQKGPLAPYNLDIHYADALSSYNPSLPLPYHVSYMDGLDAWAYMKPPPDETIYLFYGSNSGPVSVRNSNITGDWYVILSNEGNMSGTGVLKVEYLYP